MSKISEAKKKSIAYLCKNVLSLHCLYHVTLVISTTANNSCIYTCTYCTYTHSHMSTQRNLFRYNHKGKGFISRVRGRTHKHFKKEKGRSWERGKKDRNISNHIKSRKKKMESGRKRIIQKEMNSIVSLITLLKLSQTN